MGDITGDIAIIGSGAMGSLFAARLSPLANVVMLGSWREHLERIDREGLTLIELDGTERRTHFATTSDAGDLDQIPLALVLVKSRCTRQAGEQALRLLAPDGLAITFQNGLGNLEKLAAILGEDRAVLGVTSQGATIESAGRVRYAGPGQTVLASSPAQEQRLLDIVTLLQQAGMKTELLDNVDGLVWGKLAVNAGINPLTALLAVANGFLAENDRARSIMTHAAEEVAAVAVAMGIKLPYASASAQALNVARATASNRSSMLQDVRRGQPTEIDAICGQVIQHAKRQGVPAPVNEALYRQVKELERLARSTGGVRSEGGPRLEVLHQLWPLVRASSQ